MNDGKGGANPPSPLYKGGITAVVCSGGDCFNFVAYIFYVGKVSQRRSGLWGDNSQMHKEIPRL